MTAKPRQWITTAAAHTPRPRTGRDDLRRRVLASRREVVAWVASGSNARRVGEHLASHRTNASRTPHVGGRSLADHTALLIEFGVPGIAPPADLSAPMAARWSRSVTLVVLRQLRRQGHLPTVTEVGNGAPPATPSPPDAVRAVAARAPGPTRFPAVDLHVEHRSPERQEVDARAAVDLAREQSILARRALLSGPVGADTGPSRAAADDASVVLRAAVGALVALDSGARAPGPALQVDVVVDGPTTVVRPRGELDLVTAPRLEQVCLEQVAVGTCDALVLDLSAATFVDSSALAVMVEIRRVCLAGGTSFALTGVTTRTRRLLAITRLDTVLDVR